MMNFFSSWVNDWFGIRVIEFNNEDDEGHLYITLLTSVRSTLRVLPWNVYIKLHLIIEVFMSIHHVTHLTIR